MPKGYKEGKRDFEIAFWSKNWENSDLFLNQAD